MKHIFEKIALILDRHQRIKQSDLSSRMDAVLQRMKDSSYKHLRGRHNQLDHAWNRGMGRGGGGADLAPNQMGPMPTQDFYRQRRLDLMNQQRAGQITRDEMRRQMQDLRGITRDQPGQPAQPAQPTAPSARIPRKRAQERRGIMLDNERRHQALIPKGPQPAAQNRMLDDGDLSPADRRRRDDWVNQELMGSDTADPFETTNRWYAMETDRRARERAAQSAQNPPPHPRSYQMEKYPMAERIFQNDLKRALDERGISYTVDEMGYPDKAATDQLSGFIKADILTRRNANAQAENAGTLVDPNAPAPTPPVRSNQDRMTTNPRAEAMYQRDLKKALDNNDIQYTVDAMGYPDDAAMQQLANVDADSLNTANFNRDINSKDEDQRRAAGKLPPLANAQPAANAQPNVPAAQLSTGPVDLSAMPRVDDMVNPGEAAGQDSARLGTAIESTPYARQTPHRVDTSQPGWMEDAFERIQRGELVEFSNEGEAYTGIQEIAKYAKKLKDEGKDSNFNLCKVTVPGTNLFCGSSIATDRHPRGVPRIEMPQLSGKVMATVRDASGNEVPNPAVAGMPVNKDGEVNIAQPFINHLAQLGIGSREGVMRASNLRASQNELVGPKVGFFMTDSGQQIIDNEPIFVSRDGFVIDGHHRWAGKIGVDLADGQQGDTDIRVVVIDAPIMEILQQAIDYTADKIQPKAG